MASVQPIIALVNPKSLTIKSRPEQVKVLTATVLRRWLMNRPRVLEAAELASLAAIIDDPGTWPLPAAPATENLMARFTALDAEVRRAPVRRTLWRLLAIATSTAAAALAGPPLVTALMDALVGGVANP